jgi:Ca2+/H+ antiporter
MVQKRWLLQEVGFGSGISWFLLVIPVLFIAFITLVYALYAPMNPTVAAVLFCTALCIATAVFLISELSSPLKGTLKVSSKPVHVVRDQMGKE